MIETLDNVKTIESFKTKLALTTGPIELKDLIESGTDIKIIDVRLIDDFNKEHIPGAVNLPKEKWHTLEGLDIDKVNIVYCYSSVCQLAASACLEFAKRDFRVIELDGGFDTWKLYKLPLESKVPVG